MVFYLLKLVYNIGAVYINGLPFAKLAKKNRTSRLCSLLHMVEMVGVEPTSKSISEGISPSAADALRFACNAVTSANCRQAIPLFPYVTGSSRKVVLYK